ncbi:hypothetical protein ACFWU5_12100 [Nocardia sp. NPDC058640]|uniref:hypothetical protein n=1 Tax=Nocardia sp. NPDC058640 TaxID=3346571 RepID=UPI0036664C7E
MPTPRRGPSALLRHPGGDAAVVNSAISTRAREFAAEIGLPPLEYARTAQALRAIPAVRVQTPEICGVKY